MNIITLLKQNKLVSINLLLIIGFLAIAIGFLPPTYNVSSNKTQVFIYGETSDFHSNSMGIIVNKTNTIVLAISINQNFTVEGFENTKQLLYLSNSYVNGTVVPYFIANTTYFFSYSNFNRTFTNSNPRIHFTFIEYNSTNFHSFSIDIVL